MDSIAVDCCCLTVDPPNITPSPFEADDLSKFINDNIEILSEYESGIELVNNEMVDE